MRKVFIPVAIAAASVAGVTAVEEFWGWSQLRGAEDDLVTLHDCKDGKYPIVRHADGLLWCADVKLKELEGEVASGSTVTIEWAATEKRIQDDIDSAGNGLSLGEELLEGVFMAVIIDGLYLLAQRRNKREAVFESLGLGRNQRTQDGQSVYNSQSEHSAV